MSINGMSPALGSQHLLRSGSLAAVTSGFQDPGATAGMVRCLLQQWGRYCVQDGSLNVPIRFRPSI